MNRPTHLTDAEVLYRVATLRLMVARIDQLVRLRDAREPGFHRRRK